MVSRRAPAAPRVDLIRVMDLLQTHITTALCQAVFRRVRTTERLMRAVPGKEEYR